MPISSTAVTFSAGTEIALTKHTLTLDDHGLIFVRKFLGFCRQHNVIKRNTDMNATSSWVTAVKEGIRIVRKVMTHCIATSGSRSGSRRPWSGVGGLGRRVGMT
jgi:hypothetical protein